MDSIDFYILANATWLSVQSAALLIVPKLVIVLLSEGQASATSLEIYLSRALALPLLALAVMMAALRTASWIKDQDGAGSSRASQSAYLPILLAVIVLHSATAVLAYTAYLEQGQTGYVLGAVASAVFAVVGTWLSMFGPGSQASLRASKTHKSHWPLGERKSKRRLAEDNGDSKTR